MLASPWELGDAREVAPWVNYLPSTCEANYSWLESLGNSAAWHRLERGFRNDVQHDAHAARWERILLQVTITCVREPVVKKYSWVALPY